jgi:putative sigma-54 modulation protein
LDKLQRQIERYKGKRQRGRNGRGAPEAVSPPVEEVEEEAGPTIARRKRFPVAPMDELEAIEQMSLLGHESFFVFFNVASNSINVLYRRRDGTYGLIEPVIG